MAATTIKIRGVREDLDGDYEWEDESGPTNLELHAVKKMTGLAGKEWDEARERGDPDTLVGIALIVFMRAGKITGNPLTPWTSPEAMAIWHASSDFIGGDEDDAGPPSQSQNGTDSSEAHDSGLTSSDDSSEPSSENQADDQKVTGAPV